MKKSSGSKLSVPRKSSSSVSNQRTRAGSTANKDAQGIKKLDTNIFESYIRVLWEKIPEERRLSCTCADSMWFDMYFCKNYRQKVLRAISRIKIFTNRYVFIPICQSNHWNLLILCNLGEDIHSHTKSPCIMLLDSLPKLTGGDSFERKVREFLMDLYANEKREVSEDSINRIPFKVPNVPQQQDGIRCGYYVLYYIYRFLMCCPDEFNISEHYPGFLKKDWFSRNEIDSFCENLLSLVSETGTCNNTCSESSAASESGSVQIIDDLHTGMEVGYPVKVDDGDDNETEIDKDDDEKQEQKDTGNGLEKNNENKSPKARKTDRSESHAADDEGYRKTHKKCDAPVAPKKKSSKNFGRKGSDQKTVQKSQRVWNTSPSSDSDTLEPPLKRCSGKDCGNKGKKDVNASSDTNGPLLDESTSMPTEEPIQRETSASSGISIFVDFTQYGPLPFIRRP